MKLREFSDEDITLHALSNGGRDIRNMIVDINRDYSSLTTKYRILPKHRTLLAIMETEVGRLIERIVEMHDICRDSEDDAETVEAATELKSMSAVLNNMLDSLR